MFKVIMAPTEGSDSERAAISVAVKLAQRFDADLRLVRVETAPLIIETVARPPVLRITEQTLLDERLARLRKLEALGTECRALGEIRVMTALEDGPVAPTLRDYARKFNVDLIVMSSHSRGGVKRITLGSVTDYLIRHTNIPVLVVRPPASFIGATPEQTFSRIVVPLDGSVLAEQILPEVAALASRLKSTVSLLQVLTPLTYSQKEIMQPGLPWSAPRHDADLPRHRRITSSRRPGALVRACAARRATRSSCSRPDARGRAAAGACGRLHGRALADVEAETELARPPPPGLRGAVRPGLALLVRSRRTRQEARRAEKLAEPGELVGRWLESLPFEPTGDQREGDARPVDEDLVTGPPDAAPPDGRGRLGQDRRRPVRDAARRRGLAARRRSWRRPRRWPSSTSSRASGRSLPRGRRLIGPDRAPDRLDFGARAPRRARAARGRASFGSWSGRTR